MFLCGIFFSNEHFYIKELIIFRGRPSRPIPSILRPSGRDSYYDDQDFDELSPTTTLTPSDAGKPISLLPQVLSNIFYLSTLYLNPRLYIILLIKNIYMYYHV